MAIHTAHMETSGRLSQRLDQHRLNREGCSEEKIRVDVFHFGATQQRVAQLRSCTRTPLLTIHAENQSVLCHRRFAIRRCFFIADSSAFVSWETSSPASPSPTSFSPPPNIHAHLLIWKRIPLSCDGGAFWVPFIGVVDAARGLQRLKRDSGHYSHLSECSVLTGVGSSS